MIPFRENSRVVITLLSRLQFISINGKFYDLILLIIWAWSRSLVVQEKRRFFIALFFVGVLLNLWMVWEGRELSVSEGVEVEETLWNFELFWKFQLMICFLEILGNFCSTFCQNHSLTDFAVLADDKWFETFQSKG